MRPYVLALLTFFAVSASSAPVSREFAVTSHVLVRRVSPSDKDEQPRTRRTMAPFKDGSQTPVNPALQVGGNVRNAPARPPPPGQEKQGTKRKSPDADHSASINQKKADFGSASIDWFSASNTVPQSMATDKNFRSLMVDAYVAELLNEHTDRYQGPRTHSASINQKKTDLGSASFDWSSAPNIPRSMATDRNLRSLMVDAYVADQSNEHTDRYLNQGPRRNTASRNLEHGPDLGLKAASKAIHGPAGPDSRLSFDELERYLMTPPTRGVHGLSPHLG